MFWLIAVALLAIPVVVVVVWTVRKERTVRPGLIIWRLTVTVVALGLTSWWLIQQPPVNDALLGDLPRELTDFARMCEDDGNGDPFPRAASYVPRGPGPHPAAAFTSGGDDGGANWASTGTEWQELDPDDKPDPIEVQLVVCEKKVESVTSTEITCHYRGEDQPEKTGTIMLAQGAYTITVFVARTGELVGNRRVEGAVPVESECDSREFEASLDR
ncbi:hypothetical protein ACFWYW_57990 [Nonomuraea sp. NPDC059023]|uniref:hypothetical protein n=1 Tax=unclassified Nonomuraea TaxID=2593643 RepID=UPI0036B3C272